MPARRRTRAADSGTTPRVVDVLRAHAPEFACRAKSGLPTHVRSALAQLTACGTAALGMHAWCCTTCGETRVAYNACRHRHCPSCGGAKRAKWLKQVIERILPVTHFHLVFTLPHELSSLILGNREALYGLLFQSAWETLRDVALDPRHLGAHVGAIMVLHTWGQTLEHHPHVHAVVPGGGLSLDGDKWIAARSGQSPFFLPVKVLSRLYRGKFLAGLRRLRAEGKLRLDVRVDGETEPLSDDGTFARFLTQLHKHEWVVYSQPPARADQGPKAVLKYLARYVAGSAIHDGRMLAHDPAANDGAGRVEFRAKNYRQGRERMTLELTGLEFARRFALHILPSRFTRIRYYGLLAHRDLEQRLAHCRDRIAATSPTPVATAPSAIVAAAPPRCCPECNAPTWIRLTSGLGLRPTLWQIYCMSPFFHPATSPRPPP